MAIVFQVMHALIVDDNVLEGSLTTKQTIALTTGELVLHDQIIVADNYTTVDVLSNIAVNTGYSSIYVVSNVEILAQGFWIGTGVTGISFTQKVPANILTQIAGIGGNAGNLTGGSETDEAVLLGTAKTITVKRNVAEGIGDATVSVYLLK